MTKHNYAEKTIDELDELADRYFRLHAEARRAFNETGKEYWDQAMKEYMAEICAIDQTILAKEVEAAETAEVAL